MTIPTTTPRCLGTPTADECQSCARRIEPPRSWPVWLTMIVPPIKRPCSQRIENVKETT